MSAAMRTQTCALTDGGASHTSPHLAPPKSSTF